MRLLCFLKLLSSSVRHTLFFFYAFLSGGASDSPTALGTDRSETDDPQYCTSPSSFGRRGRRLKSRPNEVFHHGKRNLKRRDKRTGPAASFVGSRGSITPDSSFLILALYLITFSYLTSTRVCSYTRINVKYNGYLAKLKFFIDCTKKMKF